MPGLLEHRVLLRDFILVVRAEGLAMSVYDLAATLDAIDPANLTYDNWLRVGLSLHAEGMGVEDWDSWSRRDSRYKPGDCETRWSGFHGSATPVTGGSLIAIAREQGIEPVRSDGHELPWDGVIGGRAARETPRQHEQMLGILQARTAPSARQGCRNRPERCHRLRPLPQRRACQVPFQ